ncbi:CRAL-TRIO domain-containing protein [Microdochium trichocladiopsis]|uniref:Phosphatidylinositol transfer protein SFH5 n=1 Tax=Microdochium trichocladiopsis TaxID=1682393 RepID=A0A9P8XUV3_9PEZI|nr:CRAL-TRIO domain-containing protein [Microdochium trichocladiopsis]KAH7018547.1 CRAL-TRIO domain-containing protein [Microdochium trichocladiopsis]
MADPVVKDVPVAESATASTVEGTATAPDTTLTAATEPPVPAASASEKTETAEPVPQSEAAAETAPTETTTPAAAAAEAAKLDEPSTPLQELWLVASKHAHKEIWGVTLADPATHIPSQIILQKYLNANDGDIVKARDQLTKTLDWRAKTKPLELLEKSFSKTKFSGLGYVTVHSATSAGSQEPEQTEVFTWNIYGAVKDMNETFGSLEEFIEWRVTLMEQAVHALNLPSATKAITSSYDPYKIFQVHDYKTISFFRPPPKVKNASTETIKVLALAYPELLKEKFFVNVPALMGFMYGLMKLFVAAKTIKKFHPMSNGGALALEFPDSKVAGLGDMLPKEYGGKGEDLAVQGKETKLA